jgi:hypothetical protein
VLACHAADVAHDMPYSQTPKAKFPSNADGHAGFQAREVSVRQLYPGRTDGIRAEVFREGARVVVTALEFLLGLGIVRGTRRSTMSLPLCFRITGRNIG